MKSKNIRRIVRIPLRTKTDLDPGLRAYNLERCDRIFSRTLKSLKEAARRSEIEAPVILPSHPTNTAHENVLPVNDGAVMLLSIYDEKISSAIEQKDAELTALLGIQLGQVVAGLPLNECVRRGHSVAIGGGKRNPVKAAKRKRFQNEFEFYVRTKFVEYKKRQKANHSSATLKDFRQSVIGPLSLKLAERKDRADRAIGRKLMGKAGTDGDGIMSNKQLKRIIGRTTSLTHQL